MELIRDLSRMSHSTINLDGVTVGVNVHVLSLTTQMIGSYDEYNW